FDLKQGGTNYYNDAKKQIQGAAASFSQTIASFSQSAQVQADPTAVAAYTSQFGQYFSSLQRVQTKNNLLDQAGLQQLQRNRAAAATNTDLVARSNALAQAYQVYANQYSAPSNAPAF